MVETTQECFDDRERLKPLVEAVTARAAEPCEAAKKERWARHQALLPTDKVPVCVSYEGIPASEWDAMFGPKHLRTVTPLARSLEFDLKRRMWMAAHVPDDHIVWPFVTVSAITREERGWGVPLEWQPPDDPLGAKRIIAPFAEEVDISRLTEAVTVVDEAATALRAERAAELVGGRMPVQVRYPHMGHQPWEIVVRLRGMERLLMDVIDQPTAVHGMMALVTAAMVAHHLLREKRGWINVAPDPAGAFHAGDFMRVNASFLSPDFGTRSPRLRDEWAYVSAQSAAGLGPAMFEEFVHQYNARLAAPYTDGTVYYHGCERLDHKLDSLVRLPNLRRLHVSPWSTVAAAREKTDGRVVLEVHAHPGKVLFGLSPQEMRAELDELVAAAEGVPIDLNLSDINTVNGTPETLRIWAEMAQEAATHAPPRRQAGIPAADR
ncbi:MAG TPA: hypothetical protein VFN74_06970 [Chloroflexota bacterium]|nr:hypothetical protein [Chloroflexota bacterium]